jgi:hypothetical protein
MYHHSNTVHSTRSDQPTGQGFVAFIKPTKFGSGVMGASNEMTTLRLFYGRHCSLSRFKFKSYALRDIACRLVMNCPSRVNVEALFAKHPPWQDVAGAS